MIWPCLTGASWRIYWSFGYLAMHLSNEILCCHWLKSLWCSSNTSSQWHCNFQLTAVLLLAKRLQYHRINLVRWSLVSSSLVYHSHSCRVLMKLFCQRFRPNFRVKASKVVTVWKQNDFYTLVFRRDVLWFGAVRPSVRPFVRPKTSDC